MRGPINGMTRIRAQRPDCTLQQWRVSMRLGITIAHTGFGAPRSWSHDCQETNHPFVPRSWLGQSQTPGSVSMLVCGRQAVGELNNDYDNPQDRAWMRLIDGAKNYININTPNINEPKFREHVIQATGRNVAVNLLTSKGFNDGKNFSGHAVSVGGNNEDLMRQFINGVSALPKANRGKFTFRWFSNDGHRAVNGNNNV